MSLFSSFTNKLVCSFVSSVILLIFGSDVARLPEFIPRQPISHDLYNELSKYAHLMDIAYCISSITKIQSPFECDNGCDEFPNMEIIDQWSTSDINIIPRSFETSGYIAVDETSRQLFIVLRGTRSFKDSLIDISADMVGYVIKKEEHGKTFGCELVNGGCKVHRGFYQSFKLTWERNLNTLSTIKTLFLEKNYKVVILGHSLGGAVSVLFAINILNEFQEGEDIIDLKCITMGQPMIGNKQFTNYVNRKFNLTQSLGSDYFQSFQYGNMIRVTHLDDPIVKMPIYDHHLIGMDDYTHFNNEIFIDELGNQPPEPEKVYYCQGSEDMRCSTGMKYSTNNYEHLNYFRRMGKCGFGYI